MSAGLRARLLAHLTARMNSCGWCKGKGSVWQNYDDYGISDPKEIPCGQCVEAKALSAALDGQGDAAPRVAASQHEDDIVWRIELFRESDGRFSANFWSGDNTIGGMSNYANTPVGALAELCATLIKLDEDDAHDRRDAAPATSGSGDEAREQQEQEKKKDDAGLPR